ncbi:MAG: hypothetical protein DRP91_04835 [Candidatus Neomarinimicrobiota bacterium]|nr:MAG: hypothetical protein DRP91_04835 [Candidatus Neomarinimicrobiota bacterium]
MKFPLFIATRYIFPKQRFGYTSFLAFISIAGLSIGVCALLLTMGVLDGFEGELKNKLISFDSHIRLRTMYQLSLETPGYVDSVLSNVSEIKYVIPYVHISAMIRHGQEVEGVIVEGVRETDLKERLNIRRFIKDGRIKLDSDGIGGILVGKKLADILNAGIGDTVFLFYRGSGAGILSRMRVKKFKICGIYESGMSDYDDIFVYISLKRAQSLFNLGERFSGYQLILTEPLMADRVADKLNRKLGFPYIALSWIDLHENLVRWLKIQRFPILIVFGLILVVALFNLSSSLTMMVLEKKGEIGLLKSVGLSRKHLVIVFAIEGFIIGIVGFAIGSILALAISYLQNRFGLISIPEEVYYMSKLPMELNVENFIIGAVLTLSLSVLFTVYPALKSAKLSPTECLRYE